MAELNPDLVLLCAPNLELQIKPNHRVVFQMEGRSVSSGVHTPALLHAFRQPTTLKDAVARLNPLLSSAPDWMELMNTIMLLYQEGILIDPTQTRPVVSEKMGAFDSSSIHIAMLNDRQRTDAYLSAIREAVRPGDVVVDLGTGSGVLAIAAAQAGASRVYAIEATRIGEVAQMNFAANQFADRITLVPGLSTQVTLPERADVLVSEIIGGEPLGEQIIEYTHDAVKRFLKPEARLIPFQMRLYAQALSLPDEKRNRFFFTDEMLKQWKNWYRIDFSSMNAVTTRKPFQIQVKAYEPRVWQRLSEPALLQALDLRTVSAGVLTCEVTITAQTAGRLDGILLYPDIDLTSKIVLTRDPQQVSEDNHWLSPVWVLPEAIVAQAGEQFSIRYEYGKSNKQYSLSVTPVIA